MQFLIDTISILNWQPKCTEIVLQFRSVIRISVVYYNFGCQFSTEIVKTEIVIKSLFQLWLINLFQNDESCEFFLANDHDLG